MKQILKTKGFSLYFLLCFLFVDEEMTDIGGDHILLNSNNFKIN